MTTSESTEQSEARIEGVAAAAFLAAGVGAVVLGLLTTLNEASSGVNDFLRFSDDVGPLSGKTVISALAYGATLVVLAFVWRGRQIALRPVIWATGALLVLGLIGTFPTFFEAFAD